MTRRWGPQDRSALEPVEGGVTAPHGFLAGGISAGLKPSGKPDMALVTSDRPAQTAVVTTTNRVKAAPCVLTEQHAQDGIARAIVVNSGGANALVGEQGMRDATATAAAVAAELDIPTSEVLVMSTGIIGVRLPIALLLDGVPRLAADLDAGGGARAAEAICTTDTVLKQVAYEVSDESGTCRIGGMAKGAGMIEPAMATMLCAITTDAPLSASVLRPMLRQAVHRTFNRISIDACGSTNDTVAVLANGAAETPPALATFQTALEIVCAELARAVVEDGEGSNRTGVVTVEGAGSEQDAVDLARAICSSVLFRAALHGADPNWGRILSAMGTSHVEFDPERVSVSCGGITVCRFGSEVTFDRAQAANAMSSEEVEIVVDVGAGREHATMLTAELSPQYVAENAYYTT